MYSSLPLAKNEIRSAAFATLFGSDTSAVMLALKKYAGAAGINQRGAQGLRGSGKRLQYLAEWTQ